MSKMKLLVAVVAGLALAGLASAQLPAVDFQESGADILAGFEEFAPGDTVTTPLNQALAGGQTLTVTPKIIAGVGTPEFQDRNRNNLIVSSGTTCGRADGLFDNARVSIQGGWGDVTKVPCMGIEISGLAADTAYPVRFGAYNVWNVLIHQIISPAGGTTGPTVPFVHGTGVPMADLDSSVLITYTTDAAGVLSVDYAWDVAAYTAYEAQNPGYQAETAANLGYLEVVPEPATMALLALGGLLALRRRR